MDWQAADYEDPAWRDYIEHLYRIVESQSLIVNHRHSEARSAALKAYEEAQTAAGPCIKVRSPEES